MKLRSVPFVLALLALSGCYYDDMHGHHGCGYYDCGDGTPYPSPQNVPQATIDTGATMAEIQPGQGAGAFIEYPGDGHWRVSTTCDTEVSSYACRWDIVASVMPTGSLLGWSPEDNLEVGDYIDYYDSQSVRFVGDTTYDFDGFRFQATPGATVRMDVYLDDEPAPRYIYWVGDGGLHQGAPSNPIDLKPSTP